MSFNCPRHRFFFFVWFLNLFLRICQVQPVSITQTITHQRKARDLFVLRYIHYFSSRRYDIRYREGQAQSVSSCVIWSRDREAAAKRRARNTSLRSNKSQRRKQTAINAVRPGESRRIHTRQTDRPISAMASVVSVGSGTSPLSSGYEYLPNVADSIEDADEAFWAAYNNLESDSAGAGFMPSPTNNSLGSSWAVLGGPGGNHIEPSPPALSPLRSDFDQQSQNGPFSATSTVPNDAHFLGQTIAQGGPRYLVPEEFVFDNSQLSGKGATGETYRVLRINVSIVLTGLKQTLEHYMLSHRCLPG